LAIEKSFCLIIKFIAHKYVDIIIVSRFIPFISLIFVSFYLSVKLISLAEFNVASKMV